MRLVSSIDFARRAFPGELLCERPSRAFDKFSSLYPGRLAQGPDEKLLIFGFAVGFILVFFCLPHDLNTDLNSDFLF